MQMKEKNVLLTQSSLHYGFPDGFCFDERACNLGWKYTDYITEQNVASKADEFSLLLRNASLSYKNNHTLFMMLGDDFAFMHSE